MAGSSKGSRSVADLVRRYGVVIAFGVMIIVFWVLRPGAFMTLHNWQTMLQLAAPLAVLAFGVTVVLAAGDFDLSIAGSLSLASAVSVLLMAENGAPWPLACLAGLVVAVLVGVVNGYLTSYVGAPPFIVTLAVGQALSGTALLITSNRTIYSGIPSGFIKFTAGFNVVIIAIVAALLLATFMARTPGGRYIYAIGINANAATYAGLRVKFWRLTAFVVVAAAASLAGMMIASQSSAHSPDVGLPYLLPAYAAAFLGSAVGVPGKFTILGTVLGVVFLQVLATGLAMLSLPGAAILIIQGAVLAGAIVLNQLSRRAEHR